MVRLFRDSWGPAEAGEEKEEKWGGGMGEGGGGGGIGGRGIVEPVWKSLDQLETPWAQLASFLTV